MRRRRVSLLPQSRVLHVSCVHDFRFLVSQSRVLHVSYVHDFRTHVSSQQAVFQWVFLHRAVDTLVLCGSGCVVARQLLQLVLALAA